MSARVDVPLPIAVSAQQPKPKQQQKQEPKATADRATKASRMVLPNALLKQLIGRRVLVLLSHQQEELEGTLMGVEDDASVFLDDLVHYSTTAASVASGNEQAHVRRDVLHRAPRAVVNGAFISLVTPV